MTVLQELMERAHGLTADEQLRLAAYLVERAPCATPRRIPMARPGWPRARFARRGRSGMGIRNVVRIGAPRGPMEP
jgi:hypothetical protein